MHRLGHHLGTAQACLPALLLKPTAGRTDRTYGKYVNHGRKEPDDPAGKLAALTVEVCTPLLLAMRGETEHFRGLNGRCLSQQLIGNRDDFLQVRQALPFSGCRDNAQEAHLLHLGLRTGAQEVLRFGHACSPGLGACRT